MRIIIQSVVILAAIFMVSISVGKRSTYSGRAWKKIALIVFAFAMIFSVLFPNAINTIAHFVGVGRGADLLLYGTVVAFILYTLNSYLYQQDQRDRMFRLARKIAIIEASEPIHNKKIYDITNSTKKSF